MRPHVLLAVVAFSSLLAVGCRLPPASKPLLNGVAAAREGSWDEAVRQWKRALDLGPGAAAAHNNLAVAYERQGAFEKARKEYEAALRLDPDNATIKSNFDKFKSLLAAGRGRKP
jgi:Flp pilus assembly protein TadD